MSVFDSSWMPVSYTHLDVYKRQVLINGNQTCMMYLYYILTQYKQLGKIKGNEFCVKTIVCLLYTSLCGSCE